MDMFMVDLHSNLRAARSHIDVESGNAIGTHQRCVVFFEEQQIYRIDHYLGKESVQNLMAISLVLTTV